MRNVKCPHCAATLSAQTEYEGRKVKCKSCGKSFVLRFRSRMPLTGGSTLNLIDEELLPKPVEEEGPPTSVKMTIAVEAWRAAVYQQVADERFNRDLSAFARAAFDAMAEQLGYPLPSTDKPKSAE
jgi:predicted Zn finger-like uncharacterized protein